MNELVAMICTALNDPKRLILLYALAKRPHTVGELCKILDAPQSNTSQHLGVLRNRGLVRTDRQGNTVIYSLQHPGVVDALDLLRRVLEDELARLQTRRDLREASKS